MPNEPRRGMRFHLVVTRLLLALGASILLLLVAGVAVAAAADIGHKDHTVTGGALSGSKPESKLWYNDGFWWASMRSASPAGFYIYKLDANTETWNRTSTPIDPRSGTRSDTLWDGTKLYVASQHFNADGGGTGSGTNFETRLYRYSYNGSTDTYTLDGGFPASMRTGIQSETLVIAKDSTGTLWATWTLANSTSTNLVYTAHTIGSNDATWSAPAALPVGSANTSDNDDIASAIAFSVSGQSRVGVFWSNQRVSPTKDYFAWHVDGAADTAWTLETALSGTNQADDHMNLKTDASGQLYAVVKTSLTGSNPLIKLLRRTTGGTWNDFVVGIANVGSNTRAILELEEKGSGNILHVFMTGARTAGGSGQSGGDIFEKTSPTSSISFVAGIGTPVIRDDASAEMNDATSTKQNLNSTTGVVVLAFNDSTDTYWHHHAAISGGGAPVADFSASPATGPPGQTVTFTDQSSNSPNQWLWDFGDPSSGVANSSGLQNPTHQYAGAGQYTVKLTATNGSGSNQVIKSNYITISSGGGSTITLAPDADAQIKVGSSTPVSDTTHLRTREENPVASATYRSYLRFNVQGITGTVSGVTLRLYVTTASSNLQTVYNTTGNQNWPESTANSTNVPTIGSAVSVAPVAASPAGAYKDVPLNPSSIGGNGLVTFAIKSASTTSAYFASKELTSPVAPPQLVITQTVSGTAPTASATSATVTEDGSGPVALTGTDPETCELTFSIVTPPAHGSLGSISGNVCASGTPNSDSASVTYTPAGNYSASDSFTYKVNDGTTDSTPATATLTVTAVNDVPTANAVSTTVATGTPKVITLGGGDVETCDLVFSIVTPPTHGTLAGGGTITNKTCAGTGPFTDTAEVTYTATSGSADSFTYRVNDGAADSLDATVTITITPPNATPTANATSKTTNEDTPATVDLSGGDAETCELTFTIVSPPTHGSLGSIGNNACAPGSPNADSASVTYTPAANYNSSDSFTYKVSDGTNDSAPAIASLNVNSVNDLPSAAATSASTPQNTPKIVNLSGSDVETCELGFTIVTGPSHGGLGSISNSACAGGSPNTDSASVTYTPTSGYTGGDSFTYKVTDGQPADSALATATLDVTGGSPTTITLNPVADSHVNSGSPTANYGTLTPIRTREDPTLATPTYRPYFQFNVPSFSGTVSSVKLRLFVTAASSAMTQSVYLVGNGWTESGITWTNAPVLPGSSIGSAIAGTANAYVEFTLTTPISPNTTYSFALKSSGTTSVYFSTREDATNKPQLVIVTQ